MKEEMGSLQNAGLPANRGSPRNPTRAYDPEQGRYILIFCLCSSGPASWNVLPSPFQIVKTQIKSHPLHEAQGFRTQLETRQSGAHSQLLHLQLQSLGLNLSVPQFNLSFVKQGYK